MVDGMRELGFETLLDDRWLSPIIVTFCCPDDPNFRFDRFYDLMKDKGFIIYPGKLTVVDSFRVGLHRTDGRACHAAGRGCGETFVGGNGRCQCGAAEAALQERAKLAA